MELEMRARSRIEAKKQCALQVSDAVGGLADSF